MVERVGFASWERPMEKREDFFIPEDIVEWIGLKKSELLSQLILEQRPGDISFEEFHLFDRFVPSTIENPDRTYQKNDEDQRIRTYLKSYDVESLFHQVVIGVLVEDRSTGSDVFVPIISFVSRDSELIRNFTMGDVLLKPVLN
jgi:hypothetical protein